MRFVWDDAGQNMLSKIAGNTEVKGYEPNQRKLRIRYFGKMYALHRSLNSHHIITALQDNKLIVRNGLNGNKQLAVNCAFSLSYDNNAPNEKKLKKHDDYLVAHVVGYRKHSTKKRVYMCGDIARPLVSFAACHTIACFMLVWLIGWIPIESFFILCLKKLAQRLKKNFCLEFQLDVSFV
ncbi:hypothetical protein RFI_29600 [Reticulomyxa filosa]|uniref:Uncharacterized protein n=1 Tax=Reticulomyxa filosa TaxID=46433 RepID=X6M434_RETFI|nr:hypothetical protein RFI_29600 [Reticulomyxa filosa]|eukprot:ETO07790.1 hypothetical protein RFI_29600 [Reticulomyxa filosa]